jgi:methionyl-tRNA formyltransferase
VNFHSGRLPEFGGLESEFWALYEGEAQAWVTLHELRSDLDSGDILAEQAVPVVPGESPQGLHRKCIETARTMLPVLLDRLAAGDRTPVRVPGPARLRPWPTNAQRHELRLRDR